MSTEIRAPFETFVDAAGAPLEGGYIYIGAYGADPVTNPIAVYWDAALSVAASLPIRTVGGFPDRSGSPGRMYVGTNYAIEVQESDATVVYSEDIAAAAPDYAVREVTSNATLTSVDAGKLIQVDATSGNVTVTLPGASAMDGLAPISFIRADASAYTVTIDGAASETINGAASISLGYKFATATLRSDGTEWWHEGVAPALGSVLSTYGGSANAITLTTGRALPYLRAGQEFTFKASATNTGATTINIDGLGAKTAKTPTGAALPADYIRTDVYMTARYDGTDMIVSRPVEMPSSVGANGWWVRHENGLQECWHEVTCVYISLVHAIQATWTYEKPFSAAPIVIPTINTGNLNLTGGPAIGEINSAFNNANPTTTEAVIRINRINGMTSFVSGNFISSQVRAIGRWY